ncbi:MAG TPA: hypothetical protein VH878_09130 [Thermodesulfobacteriota bacterium]|jgi:hypothetical protein
MNLKLPLLLLVLSFIPLFPIPGFTSDKQQTIEGQIFCVEQDKEGKVNTINQYVDCKGVLLVVDTDGKTYSLSGSKQEIQKLANNPQRIKKITGNVSGNNRAWLFSISSLEPLTPQKTEEMTIKGDIFCLIPTPDKKNILAVISTEPCSELQPHAHVIKTPEGTIYSIHGPEEKMIEIEKNPNRKNVSVSGTVKETDSGSVLLIK